MGLFGRRSKNTKDAAQRAAPTPPQHEAAPPTTAIPRLSAMGAPMWNGRPLDLPGPVSTGSASELAQQFADSVDVADSPIESLSPLDFTAPSLATIDSILGQLEPIGSDEPAEAIFVAGLYIGEVLVRGHGFRWLDASGESAHTSRFGLVVQSPRGELIDSIGAAFARVERGSDDSVAHFVRTMAAAAERA